MKAILLLALVFSILSDFASSTVLEDEPLSHFETLISCHDSDLHTSSEEQHESHRDEHNCHIGHSHSLVINTVNNEISPPKAEILIMFPTYTLGNIQHYLSDINRPPIS